ncbi:MAG: YitT family protein, partial [Lachnospiraceae bacterium]|nr:YitT family protein [Lachnospiraceae bacterium]
MMKKIKNWSVITLSVFIMAVGVYFFKFPNNFCFGGVTGAAVVFAKITPLSAGVFSFIVNMILLAVGFIFLGKPFALKTTYATVLLSSLLLVFEKIFPMDKPLSNEPMLELAFAIALPAIASALLFYEGASSGGTDVIAMIVKKYTQMEDIGIALFITDLVMIIIACFVFDIKTALYSFVGLALKSFLIDATIENIMLRKSIMITCNDKDAICKFITEELNKSATIVEAKGAYTNDDTYLIFTTLTRHQAVAVR